MYVHFSLESFQRVLAYRQIFQDVKSGCSASLQPAFGQILRPQARYATSSVAGEDGGSGLSRLFWLSRSRDSHFQTKSRWLMVGGTSTRVRSEQSSREKPASVEEWCTSLKLKGHNVFENILNTRIVVQIHWRLDPSHNLIQTWVLFIKRYWFHFKLK